MRFQQQAHHYFGNLPATDDLGSWLALMQHHGVPTRLLDWTMSPYVALYFAFAEESQDASSAVWALDLHWLQSNGRETLGFEATASSIDHVQARTAHINHLIGQTEMPIIVQIDLHGMSERMIAQQGLLLCKLFHQTSFNHILMTMIIHPDVPDQPVLRKLTIEKRLRIDILKRLREMNIHAASLFPGIDGVGRSLRLDLEIKVKSAQASASDPGRSRLATCEAD